MSTPVTDDVLSVVSHVLENPVYYNGGVQLSTIQDEHRRSILSKLRLLTEELVLWNGKPEGSLKLVTHLLRERDPKLAREFKAKRLDRNEGNCDVCDKNYLALYGRDCAMAIFEVHHTKPLHSYNKIRKTKSAELALVCGTCHNLVHRARGNILSIDKASLIMTRKI
jgi:predicted HNH restriction endonuclease